LNEYNLDKTKNPFDVLKRVLEICELHL